MFPGNTAAPLFSLEIHLGPGAAGASREKGQRMVVAGTKLREPVAGQELRTVVAGKDGRQLLERHCERRVQGNVIASAARREIPS